MENRSQVRRRRRREHTSEEQESRGEEINKEPQESMADLQDEQYIYVETRRPARALEEHVPPPPLIALQPPQPPAEPNSTHDSTIV